MGFKKFVRKVFTQPEIEEWDPADGPPPGGIRKGRVGILVVALLAAAAAFFGFEIPEPLMALIAGALE